MFQLNHLDKLLRLRTDLLAAQMGSARDLPSEVSELLPTQGSSEAPPG